MKRLILAAFLILVASPASAIISGSVGTITPPSSCLQGSSLPDGCSGAQSNGTTVSTTILDTKKVVALNLVAGSGYTNGTYTWTTSGGGGSAATGTVTVTGNALASYTISNEGSGYTSRPTIAVPAGAGAGTGGSIIPSVYQLTPHNAGTTYNVPGVDYPVGYDTNLALKDPTTLANIPAGCSASKSGSAPVIVRITAGPCTLNGFDFSGNAAILNIDGSLSGIVLTNNKFLEPADNTQAYSVHLASGTCDFTAKYNEFDGGAVIGTSTGHQSVADVSSACSSGTFVFEYNYGHNAYYKTVNYGGAPGSPATLTVTERFNVFRNISLGNVSFGHGEAEYAFSGTTNETVAFTSQYNFYWDEWAVAAATSGSQTAILSATADDVILNPATVDHNVIFGPGPYAVTGSDNSHAGPPWTGSADTFGGHQEGGSLSNGTMHDDYLDYSGKLETYNGSGGTLAGDFPALADFNAATGNGCNTTTCN